MNFARYSRTMLLDEINIAGQENICNSSLVVVGCGGLASFVLPTLVACGVKKITIIDFDKIEISNLPRQVIFNENDIDKHKVLVAKDYLSKINSNCEIDAIVENHEVLCDVKNYDAIVDLTDSVTSRYNSNKVSIQNKKPFFTGSAIGFKGHVYSFANHLENFPCYECLFPDDSSDDCQTCANAGVFSPIVEIVGGFVSSNILKHFAKIKVDFEEFLIIDLLSKTKKIKLNKDLQCQCCKKF